MYSIAYGVIGGKMQDYFLESLKLQRIDFFLKLLYLIVIAAAAFLFFKYVFRDAASEDESYKAKKARLKAEKQVIKQIKKQEKMKKGAAK